MSYPVLWLKLLADDDTLRRLILPGVKVKSRVGYEAVIRCSYTAGVVLAPLLAGMMQAGLVHLTGARWSAPRPEPAPWPVIEAVLRPHVKPFVLADGFILPYQRDALAFNWNRSGGGMWHPTGTGKTLTSVLLSLRTRKLKVVFTRAASRLQYGYEVHRFTNYTPYVWLPPNERRPPRKGATGSVRAVRELACAMEPAEFIADNPGGFLVAAWDNISDVFALMRKGQVGVVVFDEVHRAKNHKRWDRIPLSPDEVAAARVEAKQRGGFVVEDEEGASMMVPKENASAYASRFAKISDLVVSATATPTKDRARDLYAQLDVLDPGGFGSATNFLDRYADRRVDDRGYMDSKGSSNEEELAQRARLLVHQIDSSVTSAQLPPKRRVIHTVSAEDQIRALGDDDADKKAKKGSGYKQLEYHLMRAASMKRRAIRNLVLDHVDAGHKIVVFTGRRADCGYLFAEMRKIQTLQVWEAHGGLPAAERQDITDAYMAHAGPCVLVATGQSMGESINLQDTDAAIFAMLPWTPGDLVQWEGRFSRLGQKRPVTLYYTVAEDSVDERVVSILLDKLGQVAKLSPDTQVDNIKAALSGENDAEQVLDRLAAYFAERGDVGVGDDVQEEWT
jgi:hypothetical protein